MDKQKQAPVAEQQQAPAQEPQKNILFGILQYDSLESLDQFIASISDKNAFMLITAGLRWAQSKGVYNLEESEIISKTLRVIQVMNQQAQQVAEAPAPEETKDAAETAIPETSQN